MKNKLTVFFALISIILAIVLIVDLVCKKENKDKSSQWTREQAWKWKEDSGWHTGFSYVPSYAVNQYEIWQEDTFDPNVLDKELALAEQAGYSLVRIYLMEGVWYVDRDGFKSRIDTFLRIADSHGLKTVFTFFSNGGNHDLEFGPGPQPAPKVGVHGSGVWVPSPGKKVIENPEEWPKLKEYVQDILRTYKDDDRIYYWCLCNEPENFKNGCDVSKFMPEVYKWAWEIRPSQPLTSPVWQRPGKGGTSTKLDIVAFVCENSDIITFHCYHTPDECQKEIEMLSRFGRPMVCQEYLARNFNNTFFNILPILKENNIDAINWGLVNNANHYHYPWGHKPEDPEPEVWFHDVFHSDYTPYDPAEIEFLKEMTQK